MNQLNQLLEYMKIHLISLNQDLETIEKESLLDDSVDWHFANGQIIATEHLLSVADDILMSSNFDDIHYSGGIH